MSSIDNLEEKKRIKEQADMLKGAELSGPEGMISGIREYGFDTAVKLRQQLGEYLTALNKEDMKDFIPAVTVAVFKNRTETQEYDEISPFIYEF